MALSPRILFWLTSAFLLGLVALLALFWSPILISYIILGPLFAIGIADQLQRKHAIRRNFPVIGHGRYLLEAIRPEINQYFIESNTDGTPFNREQRSVVYQRSKGVTDTTPFGTQLDVYQPGYEWIDHSLRCKTPSHVVPRVIFGAGRCSQPYAASLLNISAMSYGSLSRNAVVALNNGAKRGGFAHNTGEGGLSSHHLEGGGDLIWQLGTGYFGARTAEGKFDPDKFAERSRTAQVKMIEIKLSQGAKPGHGGILPASKLTREIAEIRGVPMGQDVISPPAHSAFDNPLTLLEFVEDLRELSGGKPVGFKLCVGRKTEFLGICKAMLATGVVPDFITVDGAEGGTGAAPLEFSNRIGVPLTEGLVFVHNALIGIGLRDQIRIIAAGKVSTGFDMARLLAIGADTCNSARAMMFALGCIQARRCNNNDCPTGVATQNPTLVAGLDIEDKAERVFRFHKATVHAFLELLAAAGFDKPEELKPIHLHRRLDFHREKSYAELFDYIEPKILLGDMAPHAWAMMWKEASADRF
ncbi:MAG: FMN-binding glutamate synthase family protein [Deltaproteobacteria bacterium]|nr:FMN-binding glutamate synthase family protein [Deltaproteobacteria bacterium]